MEQYISGGDEDAVTTIRRADGLNGTVTITALGQDELGIRRWRLTGDPICPGGLLGNRPADYAAAVRSAQRALDQPQRRSMAWLDPDAIRLPKVMVEPPVGNNRARDEYNRPQPLDDEAMEWPRRRVTPEHLMGIIRRHLSKSEYLRKWRDANPQLARQRKREAVAARRARRAAAERLREFSHATAFLLTEEYKAARAAQATKVDRRVRKKFPRLHGDVPRKTY